MFRQALQVKKFHDTFGIERMNLREMKAEEVNLRINLLKEELSELDEAMHDNDLIETLDALTDIMYLVLGTADILGMSFYLEDAFEEVHASNMSKLENGKVLYREDGKILKGKYFFPPNLEQFFNT
jgi:predicted HAD superfamily Cof-like phosphohydrolase